MTKINTISILVLLNLSLIFIGCEKKRTGTPEEQIVSAVAAGDVEAVKELLKSGISANTRDKGSDQEKGAPILFYAASRQLPEHFEIVKLLVENKAEINFYHDTAYTPSSGSNRI